MGRLVLPFNRTGIFGIRSVGSPTITTEDVTLHFEEHPYLRAPYNGILILEITSGVPTETTDTLPVFFQTGNGAKVAVTKAGGVPLTAGDIEQSGFLLLFFDRGAGVLQVFNSVV